MPLSDTAIRNAKPSPNGKDLKLSDGGGLFLLIKPAGQKYWRMNYRFLGKQKTLAVGVYPLVSLKEARELREAAKRKLLQGIDPSEHKRQVKSMRSELAGNSFEVIAKEWLAKQKPGWTASNHYKVEHSLEVDLFPYIGHRPITEITAPEILKALNKVVDRGTADTAHRIKQRASAVFRYAIATGRAERDPVPDLRGALPSVRKQNFAAIKDPKRVGDLLRMIEGYSGTLVVKSALRLAPLVFVRPGNLRTAEWSELDLEAGIWRIPGEKMKMGEMHIVPLSTQAVAILKEIKPLTERRQYVFPSARSSKRPMSDNAILVALRTMGIPKEEMTGHGFRHMASTILHELGWNTDVIERQLAHGERNKVKAVYNHAQYLPERTRMMQAWADYLDQLKTRTDTSGS